jgi:hypothetical protein
MTWITGPKPLPAVLIIFLPVIGALWYLIECGFLRGTDGNNDYVHCWHNGNQDRAARRVLLLYVEVSYDAIAAAGLRQIHRLVRET